MDRNRQSELSGTQLEFTMEKTCISPYDTNPALRLLLSMNAVLALTPIKSSTNRSWRSMGLCGRGSGKLMDAITLTFLSIPGMQSTIALKA